MKTLLDFINTIQPLSADSLAELQTCFERKCYRAGTLLLSAGEVCQHLYFIERGLTRSFEIDAKGNEITSAFRAELEVIRSPNSFYDQQPALESIETLEDSILWCISYQNLKYLQSKYLDVANLSLRILENGIKNYEQRTKQLRDLSVEAHYIEFNQQQRHLACRVQLRQLASYLGTTPTNLSRIRHLLMDTDRAVFSKPVKAPF